MAAAVAAAVAAETDTQTEEEAGADQVREGPENSEKEDASHAERKATSRGIALMQGAEEDHQWEEETETTEETTAEDHQEAVPDPLRGETVGTEEEVEEEEITRALHQADHHQADHHQEEDLQQEAKEEETTVVLEAGIEATETRVAWRVFRHHGDAHLPVWTSANKLINFKP